MENFVKNLIEQHKFATRQLNRIEFCIESGNALEVVNNGEISLGSISNLLLQ